MPIRTLDPSTVAAARLNALAFGCPVPEAAQKLARWQIANGGLLVPIAVPLAELPPYDGAARGPGFFRERAKQMRALIAKRLVLDASGAQKLSFTMSGKEAWYLGPRPKLEAQSMLNAVASNPTKFIELMLLKELVESGARSASDTFVTGGFGPGVYLGSLSQPSKKYVELAEADYRVNLKHGLLVCDVTAKNFGRKQSAAAGSSNTRAADAGESYLVGVTRLVPDDFFELDARSRPMVGVSLDREKIRRTRLYYLNLLTEFAIRLFTKADVPFERDTFVATHCVDDAYIPLEPLASLKRPLVVVNTTSEPMDRDALAPLSRFPEYLPGYHVAGGKKTHFAAPDVRLADSVPPTLDPALNYLYLNGTGNEEFGTVRVAKNPSAEFAPARLHVAYTALARGEGVADPYTEAKFRHLLACETVATVSQGLDYGPSALAELSPGKAADGAGRHLQEAVKRSFVEVSLKEALAGHKAIPVPAMPGGMPTQLTLLATRRLRLSAKQVEQMVSAVDVDIDGAGIGVTRVRRTPWGRPGPLMEMVAEFGFLQDDGKEGVRDAQFWVVDRSNGERLRVWAGDFVPKIILNDAYEGIEHAILAQDEHLAKQRDGGSEGRFLSKGREFNLLPYYISMFKPEHTVRGESIGRRIAIQDRGEFLRVFVPPEGGISGSGDALSAMRDVMHYRGDTLTSSGLLDVALVQLYLHTMTNGVLVGGDNSKMSVLEKLARLALEN
jgi:hypothetical protein